MQTKNILYVILIVFLFIQSTAISQEVTKTGTTAAKFLSIGIGPRANAMGGAFTSLANDASAMYWNPAGVALLDRYEGIFTYTKLFADINVNFFGIALPLDEFGSVGLSVTAVNLISDLAVTTEDYPEGTGETFSAGSYAFGLSYARQITEDFLVGMTAKYVREAIANSSATGVSFDVGTIFTTPFWGVRFSSSITNYGTKMQMTGDDLLIRFDSDPNSSGNNETVDAYYSTDEFELPLRLQAGISKDIIFMDEQRFTVAVDAIFPNDNNQCVNVGGEVSFLNDLVAFRVGYKNLFLSESEINGQSYDNSQEGLTLGAGVNYNALEYFGVSVDYAFQEFKYLGDTHSFGVRLRF
jgi:hypothetical protein